MPDGGWEPLEPWRVGTRSGSAPPGGRAAGAGGRMARSPRRGRWMLGAVGLAAVAVAVAWSAVGRSGGGDPRLGSDDEALSEVRERTDEERAADAAEGDRQDTAQRAFAQASRLLELGGSYAYHGTVHAPAASDARPAQAPSPDVTVDGEVLWPLRTHDIAVDAAGRAAETITVGPTIWQREAPTREGLPTAAYAFAGDVSTWNGAVVPFGAGAARLPGWLSATTDRQYRSEAEGRTTFVATLPAERLGDTGSGSGSDPPPAADGEVELTVDADGDPLRIEVAVAGASGPGPAWRLRVDINGIGDTVAIDIPDGQLPSVTEGPSPAEVRAAGIAAPVELGQLPESWILSVITLTHDDQRPHCPRLRLAYEDVEPSSGQTPDWLDLDVLPPPCARSSDPSGPPLQAGAFIGRTALLPSGPGAVLSDGRTAVEYATSLPTDDALRLLATLEPYDPTTRPTVLEAPH